MSTLSSQVDGLREAANRMEEIGISVGHGNTASAFIMHDAVERMREAADTIEKLEPHSYQLEPWLNQEVDGMSEELKPCAHCGSRGELVTYYDFYHINCTNDDCVEHYDESMIYRGEGAWHGSIADAIEAWNTRTPEQAIATTFGRVGSEVGSEVTSEVSPHESNYTRLFGTPEKAARYFAMQCFGSDGSLCYYCPFDDCDERLRNMGTYSGVYDALLEWLRGDA